MIPEYFCWTTLYANFSYFAMLQWYVTRWFCELYSLCVCDWPVTTSTQACCTEFCCSFECRPHPTPSPRPPYCVIGCDVSLTVLKSGCPPPGGAGETATNVRSDCHHHGQHVQDIPRRWTRGTRCNIIQSIVCVCARVWQSILMVSSHWYTHCWLMPSLSHCRWWCGWQTLEGEPAYQRRTRKDDGLSVSCSALWLLLAIVARVS